LKRLGVVYELSNAEKDYYVTQVIHALSNVESDYFQLVFAVGFFLPIFKIEDHHNSL
jgi:hypothetical protein